MCIMRAYTYNEQYLLVRYCFPSLMLQEQHLLRCELIPTGSIIGGFRPNKKGRKNPLLIRIK